MKGVKVIKLDHDHDVEVCLPPVQFFIKKLQTDTPFVFLKINHGFFDTLMKLDINPNEKNYRMVARKLWEERSRFHKEVSQEDFAKMMSHVFSFFYKKKFKNTYIGVSDSGGTRTLSIIESRLITDLCWINLHKGPKYQLTQAAFNRHLQTYLKADKKVRYLFGKNGKLPAQKFKLLQGAFSFQMSQLYERLCSKMRIQNLSRGDAIRLLRSRHYHHYGNSKPGVHYTLASEDGSKRARCIDNLCKTSFRRVFLHGGIIKHYVILGTINKLFKELKKDKYNVIVVGPPHTKKYRPFISSYRHVSIPPQNAGSCIPQIKRKIVKAVDPTKNNIILGCTASVGFCFQDIIEKHSLSWLDIGQAVDLMYLTKHKRKPLEVPVGGIGSRREKSGIKRWYATTKSIKVIDLK